MELLLDYEKFEEQQEIFIREIIEQIRFKLIEAGITGENLKDLTVSLAFSIASTIDDTARIEFNGTQVKPYLSFKASDDQLIHCGENSFTHEFVTDIAKEIFEGKTEQDDN